jgi:hypothetical protein
VNNGHAGIYRHHEFGLQQQIRCETPWARSVSYRCSGRPRALVAMRTPKGDSDSSRRYVTRLTGTIRLLAAMMSQQLDVLGTLWLQLAETSTARLLTLGQGA